MGNSVVQRSIQPPHICGEMPLSNLRKERLGILPNYDAGAQKWVSVERTYQDFAPYEADGDGMLGNRHAKNYNVRLANIYFFHPFEEWESSDATTMKLLNYITAH